MAFRSGLHLIQRRNLIMSFIPQRNWVITCIRIVSSLIKFGGMEQLNQHCKRKRGKMHLRGKQSQEGGPLTLSRQIFIFYHWWWIDWGITTSSVDADEFYEFYQFTPKKETCLNPQDPRNMWILFIAVQQEMLFLTACEKKKRNMRWKCRRAADYLVSFYAINNHR